MADYSRFITPQVYRSFFAHTLDLRNVSAYLSIKVPMLAICGSGEVKDMKLSLDMLGKNTCCQTMILPKAGHDFPMRNSKELNAVLNDFLLGKIKEN
jgi:pimeloyl-ACP methyl ester carboxylesterase